MERSMRPWLSVIMPTFNGAAFLDQALRSVLAQRDEEIEVIAGDDGSADETVAILEAFRPALRLRIVRQPHGGNWAAGTARGMALARGAWLCWLHQDDAWRPGRLHVVKSLLAAHSDAAMLVHPCRYIDARGEDVGDWRCPLPRRGGVLAPLEVLERLLVQCFIGTPATVFSARAMRAAGLPDASLRYAADWDYWLRLALVGPTVYHAAPLASFRVHARSQTVTGISLAAERRVELHRVLDRYLPELQGRHPRAGLIERVARLSVEVNYGLSATLCGRPADWAALARDFAALGPGSWRRFWRDSRLIDRCWSRWRLRHAIRAANLGVDELVGIQAPHATERARRVSCSVAHAGLNEP